jgi:hypothetical protein
MARRHQPAPFMRFDPPGYGERIVASINPPE